jgi:hypothetical protein
LLNFGNSVTTSLGDLSSDSTPSDNKRKRALPSRHKHLANACLTLLESNAWRKTLGRSKKQGQ